MHFASAFFRTFDPIGRMDKSTNDAVSLKQSLESLDLDALAEQSEFSGKSRKVTALSWCVSFCLASSRKSPSLRAAAQVMGLVNSLTVTRQALHKRLHNGGAKLVAAALQAALAMKSERPKRALGTFARVLLQDSTCVALPDSMKKHYPGSSNKSARVATARIQAVYDMVSERFVEFALTPFARNDQSAAEDILDTLQADDLVVRDLGYFSSSSLRKIGERGAFYLSRLSNAIKLYDPRSGEELALRELVREDASVELEVHLGSRARLPARLVAIPLKQEIASRRRQKAKAKARQDRRWKPSKEHLELLGWQLMLTNCDRERLPGENLFELYSMRWRIETIFKSWKSGLCIESSTTHTSKTMAETLIHAALLRVTLVHAVVIPWLEKRDPSKQVSVVKLMDLISMSAELVGTDPKSNENLLENLSKHCRYEKRKRRNTLQRWDMLVSEMENLS